VIHLSIRSLNGFKLAPLRGDGSPDLSCFYYRLHASNAAAWAKAGSVIETPKESPFPSPRKGASLKKEKAELTPIE